MKSNGKGLGHGRCGAKTRAGTPCQKYPAKGRKRCRMHGGNAPRGAQSPHFKTGKYSKDFHKSLTDFQIGYERHLNSPNLLSLADNIALLDSFISEQLGALEAITGELWDKAAVQYKILERSHFEQDDQAFSKACGALSDIIEQGVEQGLIRDRVVVLSGKKRALVESERKKLIEDKLLIGVDQVNALIQSLVSVYTLAIGQFCSSALADQILLSVDQELEELKTKAEAEILVLEGNT